MKKNYCVILSIWMPSYSSKFEGFDDLKKDEDNEEEDDDFIDEDNEDGDDYSDMMDSEGGISPAIMEKSLMPLYVRFFCKIKIFVTRF